MISTETKLIEIARKIFPDYHGKLDKKTGSSQIECWDSMNHLNFLMQVQEEFKIQFEFTEIILIESLGDIINLLKEKGVE